MKIAMTLTVATCVVGLTGCASKPLIEELPVSEPLPPIERPVYQVGLTTHQIDPTTGEESSWQIKSIAEDGVITGLRNDGCEWRIGPDWFPQVLAWDNCGSNPEWSSGTREVLSTDGDMWPLAVGNTARYKYRVMSAGGDNNLESEACEVKTTARVNVAMGEIDAYRIDCVRRNEHSTQTRSWYWSPEHGQVKYTRVDSRNGVKQNQEITRIEYAAVGN